MCRMKTLLWCECHTCVDLVQCRSHDQPGISPGIISVFRQGSLRLYTQNSHARWGAYKTFILFSYELFYRLDILQKAVTAKSVQLECIFSIIETETSALPRHHRVSNQAQPQPNQKTSCWKQSRPSSKCAKFAGQTLSLCRNLRCDGASGAFIDNDNNRKSGRSASGAGSKEYSLHISLSYLRHKQSKTVQSGSPHQKCSTGALSETHSSRPSNWSVAPRQSPGHFVWFNEFVH